MLILPAVISILIAGVLFFIPSLLRREHDWTSKNEQYLQTLESDGVELTKEKASGALRRALRVAIAERRVAEGLLQGYRQLGSLLLVLSLTQCGVILYAKKQLSRTG